MKTVWPFKIASIIDAQTWFAGVAELLDALDFESGASTVKILFLLYIIKNKMCSV